jgi:CubicO group peptidase (beta-lactamase class C family)
MGHALYSTATDYTRFLRMWLRGGELDGATILRLDTTQAMLANQIGELRLPTLRSTVPFATADLSFFGEAAKSHSFFVARMEEDVAGMRFTGTAFWGGVLNTHFWLDPRNDIAAVLMTQMIPFLGPDFMGVLENTEKTVYSATS